MTRPHDWGDQYPSDTGDPTPTSPTEGLTESDYSLYPEPMRKSLTTFATFDPDLDPKEQERRIREAYFGLVLMRTTPSTSIPHYYDVVLQTGEKISAKCISLMPNETIRELDPCICIRGQFPDEWFMFAQRFVEDLNMFWYVTLTSDMASQSANATLTDLVSFTLTVYDPQNLFPRALDGAKGIVYYNSVKEQYHLVACQQAAQFLTATAGDDFDDTTNDVTVSSVAIMNRHRDQLPSISTAKNVLNLTGNSGDNLVLAWDRNSSEYIILASGGGGGGGDTHENICFGKIQGSTTNGSGSSSRTFSVKECDYDGSNVVGDAFDVHTHLKPNADTSLFEDYVVGYMTTDGGLKVIITDCWDDPIDTIKAWGSKGAIRDGWEELEDAQGRFLVGIEDSETWDDPGDTGGTDLADLETHIHDDHPGTDINCSDGDNVGLKRHLRLDYMEGDLDHSEENVQPPWYAVYWIKRTS